MDEKVQNLALHLRVKSSVQKATFGFLNNGHHATTTMLQVMNESKLLKQTHLLGPKNK